MYVSKYLYGYWSGYWNCPTSDCNLNYCIPRAVWPCDIQQSCFNRSIRLEEILSHKMKWRKNVGINSHYHSHNRLNWFHSKKLSYLTNGSIYSLQIDDTSGGWGAGASAGTSEVDHGPWELWARGSIGTHWAWLSVHNVMCTQSIATPKLADVPLVWRGLFFSPHHRCRRIFPPSNEGMMQRKWSRVWPRPQCCHWWQDI